MSAIRYGDNISALTIFSILMGGGLLGADLGTTTERFGGFFDEEEENSLDEDGESEEC